MCAEVSSIEKTFFAMGTANSVTIYEEDLTGALEECCDRTLRLHGLMSVFDPSSEVSRINSSAGNAPVSVSDDVFDLIKRCVGYSEKTGGKFDITAGPSAALWKSAIKSGSLPLSEEIKNAAALTGHRDITFDNKHGKIGLKRKGQKIDLGGIAKGFAADEARRILLEHGIENELINYGGTVIVAGETRKVGIRDPFSKDRVFASVEVADRAVVTSGYYEQFLKFGNRIYHHIIDPTTGEPPEPVFAGITLIGESAEELDAYATALFCMTAEDAFQFVNGNGVDAVFVTADRNIIITDGIKDDFSLLQDGGTL